MFRKTRNIVLVAGALAVVSVAGTALASAGAAPTGHTSANKTTVVKPAAHASKHRATGTSAAKASDTEVADGAGPAGQANDSETADGPGGADQETMDGQESGSEVSENDGPAGHADEPGNANADPEAGGQE